MSDVKVLAKEREDMYRNLLSGRIPSRIPISGAMGLDSAIKYCQMDVAEVYWDFSKAEAALDKVCQDFPSDSAPGVGRRYPSYYQILGSKPFIMSSDGTMQHPNVAGMTAEDYDDFIASPYDCIVDKILPRLYTGLDTDSNTKAMTLSKAMKVQSDDAAVIGGISARLNAKYGFVSMAGGATTGPYDFMADFFRSFTGISSDIRRIPQKVIEACEAITPILIKKGKPLGPSTFGQVGIPLHMGPFMREKDFEKFYWPTLKKQVEAITEMGINVNLFVEHDFMRFLDYFYELPPHTILRFEYGDPKIVKEKLGKKHILSGFYPLVMLHSATKEQCIDKAKELIDILAPGGNYMFGFDKGAMDMHGSISENLKAVLEYVYINGRYDDYYKGDNKDPHEALKLKRRSEIINEIDKSINSKYFTVWEKYRESHPELDGRPLNIIGPKIQKYEDMMFNFIINLCS
ncbi:uroporphyrinogen decarboxylase family protein [Oxobacter pfennigii]